MMPSFDQSKLINREFQILKVSWSLYDIDHEDVKGLLRVVGFPVNILEVPVELLPNVSNQKLFALQIQNLVSFVSKGKKGVSDPNPIIVEQIEEEQKIDITSSIMPVDEPFSEYLIAPMRNTLLRTRTTVTKVELVKGRTNSFGDPLLLIQSNTAHSVSQFKGGRVTT